MAALAELSRLGFNGLKADDLHRLREVDPYEQELIIMAEVRAYFQVAYKASDNIAVVYVIEANCISLPRELSITYLVLSTTIS